MTVEEIKSNYKAILKKCKKDILELLKNGESPRRDVIDYVVENSGMSADELSDRSASGAFSLYRSIVGTALQDMKKYGDIVINEYNTVSLKKKPSVIVKESELAPYIINLLKTRAMTFAELAESATVYFGAAETPDFDDDVSIKRVMERLMPDLVRRGKISYTGGRYSIGSDMIIIKRPHSVFEEFIAFLNSKGGEFFESYSAMLLEKYFLISGKTVSACNVIGGSDDGGIDVTLTVSDWLGFKDNVLVQCKQKTNSNVTLKEVKEFVGAFYVEKGTKGIFMTTSRFHRDASSVLSSLRDIVAIDGRKLFDIAKKCSCGIIQDGSEYVMDYGFFYAR